MTLENIRATRSNFCIGPQSGTFCTVDDEVSPVVMHVKNDTGVIIRTYTFFPHDILHTGPAPAVTNYQTLPDPTSYSFHKFVTIQYVGPYNQTSYFDGAVFYTLEKRALGSRRYYTYTNENDPEEWRNRIEYNSNIIRRWILDAANFRLELDQTFVKNSSIDNWFDANAFVVQHTLTTFDDHTTTGTESIEITTTSGLKKYDTLFLGPSSDTSNQGEVEEVYVHSITGTTVEIRTYGGTLPTKWEYMAGDPITMYQDLFLFSNPRPAINEQEIAYGISTLSGTLYKMDQTNYASITDIDYSGMYSDIVAATWNNYFSTLSFVKGTNLVHLDISDYEISRSQNINLENPNSQTIIPIYDIDIKDASVYKLQESILQHDDDGVYFEVTWDSYNYHVDTFIPYSSVITLSVSERVLVREGQSFITVGVKDQFGVGLLAKDVWFTAEGDIYGELTPSDGYMVTDADGNATVQYDAGNFYTGFEDIKVRVGGGNNAHGSAFLTAITILTQYHEHLQEAKVFLKTLDKFSTSLITNDAINATGSVCGKVAYVFPNNDLTDNSMAGWPNRTRSSSPLIRQVLQPNLSAYVSGSDEYDTLVSVKVLQTDLMLNRAVNNSNQESASIYSKSVIQNEQQISSNYISRHLLFGHIDNVTLDQYIFVQDARPVMWSLKNNINTDYWIRLRPFAASLNPATLIVKLKEESYAGVPEWEDVTSLGTITMFDAGGGILGIDFLYVPGNIFHHNSIVYVDIEVYDSATIPNKIVLTYWFKIIQDYKAPYLANQIPMVEACHVPINSSITFDLIDEGEGVDIATLEIFVNQRATDFSYDEYEPGNYHVICNLNHQFHFGEEVSVDVIVSDRSDSDNKLLDGWVFYCNDSTGPWINLDNTEPDLCIEGAKRTQPVSAQVYGINDTGIEYDSIRLEAGGKYRNLKIIPIVYRLS